MPKDVLIDLSLLKCYNSGLCNVANSFASGFSQLNEKDFAFNFLVPRQFVGQFGDAVNYTRIRKWQKRIPLLLPRVDIWHSTYQFYRAARISRKTKQILTIHDLNFLYEKRPSRIGAYLKDMQRKIDRATVVVAISQFVADDIARNLDIKNKPLKVIYNSVDRLDNDEGQQPQFVDTSKPFFFTIGQIRAKKNFHVLLDVMKHFPDINLYICGGEEGREYGQFISRRIASEGIGNAVLTGAISEQEKVWMYRHCEAFLFPSKFEGFGLPMLEAMQFGKTVFASSMTSLPEVAGGHAFIWENFETPHMVDLIKNNLKHDPDRIERMKAYAYSFNLERHTQEYLQLYREVLNNNY